MYSQIVITTIDLIVRKLVCTCSLAQITGTKVKPPLREHNFSVGIMTTAYLLLISSCLVQWSGTFTPVVYDAPSSLCGQSNHFKDDQQLMEKLKKIHQQLPPPGCNPPSTCQGILYCNSSASSGYYQIHAANGSTVQVYCDMEGTNCGGEGGWMSLSQHD